MGDGLGWVLVVNLVLWSGLFLYMLRLGRRLAAAEDTAGKRLDRRDLDSANTTDTSLDTGFNEGSQS